MIDRVRKFLMTDSLRNCVTVRVCEAMHVSPATLLRRLREHDTTLMPLVYQERARRIREAGRVNSKSAAAIVGFTTPDGYTRWARAQKDILGASGLAHRT